MESIKSFQGLNNVADPLRLDLDWLVQADNVNISDTGGISKRDGYTLALAGSPTGAYATKDFARMYLVDGGALKAMAGPSTAVTLRSGLSSAPMYWAEINQQVFFNNGADSGVILPDNTLLDWRWPVPATPVVAAVTGSLPPGQYRVACTYVLADRRETGSGDYADITLAGGQALQVSRIPQLAGAGTNVYIAPADSTVYQLARSDAPAALVWNFSPNALGIEMTPPFLAPLPLTADVVQAWRGRIYAAMYMPQQNQTVVWYSQPLGFHLFDLARDYFMVPGRVTMLAPHTNALVLGTGENVYAYDGKALEQLATYGVIPGWCWAIDDATQELNFWSQRGLCRFPPFENLTAERVSVAPGVQAGAAVIAQGGQKRFVVALHQGGSAFNQRV